MIRGREPAIALLLGLLLTISGCEDSEPGEHAGRSTSQEPQNEQPAPPNDRQGDASGSGGDVRDRDGGPRSPATPASDGGPERDELPDAADGSASQGSDAGDSSGEGSDGGSACALCEVGASVCRDGEVQVCAAVGSCLAWGAPTPCADGFCVDEETCGQCPPESCNLGATRCADGAIAICDSDDSGCRVWRASTICALGSCLDEQRCRECPHECSALGATRCAEGEAQRCEEDERGCRVWGKPQACGSGACAGERCAECRDQCASAGSTACDTGALRRCTLGKNGCLAWSAPEACATGNCADASHCLDCQHGCSTVGDTRCEAGALRSCIADKKGCRDFGPPQTCPTGACQDQRSCAQARNECADGSARCPDDATCTDQVIGYECVCGCGFSPAADGRCVAANPHTLFVNEKARGAGTGRCWRDAFQTIFAALAIAKADDEIWVAKGTYRAGTSAAASLRIGDRVSLFGGFVGTETARDDRNPRQNQTVIDGRLPNDPAATYHLVTMLGASAMDGFVLQNGNAQGQVQELGGALVVRSGSPRVEGCVFRDNRGGGGAVAVLSGHATFAGNQFEKNVGNRGACLSVAVGASVEVWGDRYGAHSEACVAVDGSGTFHQATFSSSRVGAFVSGDARFDGCTFLNNEGALIVRQGEARVSGSHFEGNRAKNGGAIGISNGTLEVSDSRFVGNVASETGGAIYMGESVLGAIRRCSFVDGKAHDGGAIGVWRDAKLALSELTFERNQAEGAGGAFYSQFTEHTEIRGARFVDNSGRHGAAIFIQVGHLVLVDGAFFGNRSLYGLVHVSGGGLEGPATQIVNSVFGRNEGQHTALLHVYNQRVLLLNTELRSNVTTAAGGDAISLTDATATLSFSSIAGTQGSPDGPLVHLWGRSRLHVEGSVVWSERPLVNADASEPASVRASCGPGEKMGALLMSDPFNDLGGADDLMGTADDDLSLRPDAPCVDLAGSVVQADLWDLDEDGDVAEALPLDRVGSLRRRGRASDAGALESSW